MGRSIFAFVVSAFKVCRGYSEKKILLHFGLRLFGRPTHVWPYPEFSSVNVGWSSYADRNLDCSLDGLFNCVSPCLMFLRFTVRCAAYAAWTTPGLAKTDLCRTNMFVPGTSFFQKVYTSSGWLPLDHNIKFTSTKWSNSQIIWCWSFGADQIEG